MNPTPSLGQRWLNAIERAGNRFPHPITLFVLLAGLVIMLSAVLAPLNIRLAHPMSGEAISIRSLLSVPGLHYVLENTVSNFVGFAPLGTVLTAMLGIGLMERSGLLSCLLRLTVMGASRRMLSFLVVFAGVISSLAVDAGYVVLIPLGAMVFMQAGLHPLGGIAAAFAGVSGGFSANLLIGPLDAVLAGLSTQSAQLIQPDYEVSPAGNYYFIVASTLVVSITGTWVTERWVLPRLPDWSAPKDQPELPAPPPEEERRALRWCGWFSLGFLALLLAGTIPEHGMLRSPDGSLLHSPFLRGVVSIVALYAGLTGLIFGHFSGSFRSRGSVTQALEDSMANMGGYLAVMFFAAQFVNYFAWTGLGATLAIAGAQFLQAMELPAIPLMIGLVLISALINLFVGSASAKWALLAPIFVPMFLLLGISPEATQAAYRIGDSSTNLITPLMPYFAMVLTFARNYDPQAGIGTVVAMMLPYALAFIVVWSILLGAWTGLNLPLGPGAQVQLIP